MVVIEPLIGGRRGDPYLQIEVRSDGRNDLGYPHVSFDGQEPTIDGYRRIGKMIADILIRERERAEEMRANDPR